MDARIKGDIRLKQWIETAPILAFTDIALVLRTRANASTQALGTVLSQVHDGKETEIAYTSHSLHTTEKNPAK